jgi:hypothetical protein
MLPSPKPFHLIARMQAGDSVFAFKGTGICSPIEQAGLY